MEEDKEKISERFGIIRKNGVTLYLSLKEEFIDMDLEEGDSALITLRKNPEGEKIIIIIPAFRLSRETKKVIEKKQTEKEIFEEIDKECQKLESEGLI